MLTISRLILLILTVRFYVFSANLTLSEEFVFAYVVLLTFSPLIFNISVVDHLFSAIAMLTQIVNIVKIIVASAYFDLTCYALLYLHFQIIFNCF